VDSLQVTADDANGEPTLHAIVRGRVQGVGYRDFVQRNAVRRGLRGWVRNREDMRSVELMASGPREALERLVGRLREGPRFAHVSEVETDWSAASEPVSGFEIRF
jgi:acylphosphatase